MRHVEFSYLYRDGSNHKKFGRVIFSNPEQTDAGVIRQQLAQAFLEDGLFIASQVRVPEVFLFASGELSLDDHCYHELDSIRTTDEVCTDFHFRTISEFLSEVIQQDERGWRVFDPYDSKGSYGHLSATRWQGV